MKHRRLASDLSVSALGLGCMGMSEFYGPSEDAQSLAALRRAHEVGITFFDTADTYGLGHNEELLAQLIREVPRDGIVIATKVGIVRAPGAYERRIDNSAAYIRSACDASLWRLGVEKIDLYYVHRLEQERPIEETMDTLAALVQEGKIGHIGLSEVGAETLRRAAAVHPVAALQTEYSLWTRHVEAEILPTCRTLGIGFVPYSPLGRGFLTGAFETQAAFGDGDFRRALPRFQEANMAANRPILETLRALAAAKEATPAQIALAWLLAQGEDVVPIPGTRRERYITENAAAVDIALSADDVALLNASVPPESVAGARYTEEGMRGVES